MASKEQKRFLKNIGDYFQVDINEHDEKMVIGYLDEYVKTIKLTPITIVKKEYVYRELEPIKVDFKPLITKDEISEVITDVSGISMAEIRGDKRYHDKVVARHVLCFLVKNYCQATLVDIKEMIKKDHSTVIHAIRNVRNMLNTNNYEYVKIYQESVKRINQIIETKKQQNNEKEKLRENNYGEFVGSNVA